MRRTAGLLLLVLTASLGAVPLTGPQAGASSAPATVAPAAPSVVEAGRKKRKKRAPVLRDVMFVGNNWAGTASVVDAHTFKVLRRGIDFIPDKEQELSDIRQAPDKLAFYLAIQQGPGEGHDQYVDDMFTTRDGRYVAVSRPSFADVVWIDVAKALAGRTDSIVREQQMDGYRTDHMGLSPDGRRLLVSDSTERQVIEYAMVPHRVNGRTVRMGDRLRTFESGETPHESNYTPDGKRVFHASIGKVYTPGDAQGAGPVKIGPVHDALKGDRWFEIVRTSDLKITQRWDMGKELAEAGYEGMSSAVRPMAIAKGERFVYFQVSYFHGLVEFDTQAKDLDGKVGYSTGSIPEPRTGAVKRVIDLPNRVPTMPLEQYVNDSAHHGLSINKAGTTLCAAGTMDDYAALIDRRTMKAKIFDKATTGRGYGKPYWTTEGLHDTCWISLSEDDAVAVLSFRTKKQVAYLAVGDHPQRVRHGYVRSSVLAANPTPRHARLAAAASLPAIGGLLAGEDDSLGGGTSGQGATQVAGPAGEEYGDGFGNGAGADPAFEPAPLPATPDPRSVDEATAALTRAENSGAADRAALTSTAEQSDGWGWPRFDGSLIWTLLAVGLAGLVTTSLLRSLTGRDRTSS